MYRIRTLWWIFEWATETPYFDTLFNFLRNFNFLHLASQILNVRSLPKSGTRVEISTVRNETVLFRSTFNPAWSSDMAVRQNCRDLSAISNDSGNSKFYILDITVFGKALFLIHAKANLLETIYLPAFHQQKNIESQSFPDQWNRMQSISMWITHEASFEVHGPSRMAWYVSLGFSFNATQKKSN